MKENKCCPDCWNSPHALKTRFKDGICGLACETCTHGNFEREPLGSNWCMCGKPFRGLKYHDKSSHDKKETDTDKQNKFFKHIHASTNICIKSWGHEGDCEEPTPPTQEQLDEASKHISFLPEEPKQTYPKDYKCEFQPTQDTESWLSDFRQSFWQLYTGYPQGTFSTRIEEWIRQKKQEWELAAKRKGFEIGRKLGEETTNDVYILRQEARTQGAEAAVEYISRIAWDGAVPDTKLVNNSILEQAKKV